MDEEVRYREIEEAVSELEQLREASAVEYRVGIPEGSLPSFVTSLVSPLAEHG